MAGAPAFLLSHQAVEVGNGRCLNQVHRQAGCTNCVEACPLAAIALNGPRPEIDEARCNRCGACLPACPVDLFVGSEIESRLLDTVRSHPAYPAVLVCGLHPTPDQPASPAKRVIRHHRCLASLDAVTLLELHATSNGQLALDTSLCASCPLGKAVSDIPHQVDAANRWLAAVGQTGAITMAGERQPHTGEQRAIVLDGNQKLVSRRSLFGRWRAQPPLSQTEPSAGDRLAGYRLPAGRRRLFRWLAQQPATAIWDHSQTLPTFATVHADAERCSACGLCAKFCPTEAMRFSATESTFSLALEPAACIDCGICTGVCPDEALVRDDVLTLAHIVNATTPGASTTELVAGPLIRCPLCAAPTAGPADGHEPGKPCHACRQGAGLVRPLHDGAGLMDDLLARVAAMRSGPPTGN
jgi:ferredoxin